jgi:hypothetical protein
VTTVSERFTRTALLGVRFWDRVSGRPVADGLELVETSSGVAATYGPHGVFAFHDLPGFSDSAYGAGDEPFWNSPPPARAPFTFRLRDRERRFLPFTFEADVPTRGLFAEDCGLTPSPPEIVGVVPLFSAPSRVAPGAVARVSADLWDAEADRHAAWAVLEVSTGTGAAYRGVADERGRVVVLFAYPEPPLHAASPSPPPGSRALSNQTWPLTLSVRYAPAAMSPPPPDPASGEPPDLCAVLTQPPATLLASGSPVTPLGTQLLAFGRELALRTPGHSELHVLPA